MGLLIVSGGKGLREVLVIFDSQFDLHIQYKKCEPFTLCVHGSHSVSEVGCYVNVSKPVRRAQRHESPVILQLGK